MFRALGLLSALAASAAAGPAWPACRSAPECNLAGTRALASGQMEAAEAAFTAETGFAWCEGQTAQMVLAHNNAALLALRRGQPLRARLLAGVALKFDPRSTAALHNARLADEAAALLPPAEGVGGRYEYLWGEPFGNSVDVQELPGRRIRFEVSATHDWNCAEMGIGPQGGADGRARLAGHEAVWETRRWTGELCRLRFSFGRDELTVTQDGGDTDCGFGHGVHVDGTYRRTSREPHFTR